jgi:hypothetical protein
MSSSIPVRTWTLLEMLSILSLSLIRRVNQKFVYNEQ